MLPHIPDSITLVGPLVLLTAASALAAKLHRHDKAEPDPGQPRTDVWAGFKAARDRHPWRET
jgi:hypothetical protein